MLLLVALSQNPALVAPPALVPNDFVEIFSGDAAVTLACWDRGMVGSCHDIAYTSLMDLTTTHGFLLLIWIIMLDFSRDNFTNYDLFRMHGCAMVCVLPSCLLEAGVPRSLEHKTWWHMSHWDLLQLLYQDVAWFHIFGWIMDHSTKAAVQQ